MHVVTEQRGGGSGGRVKRALLSGLLALAAACAVAPASASAGTLDQQQFTSDSFESVYAGHSVGQTFTAGLTGQLDQVDLSLARPGAPVVPFVVEIRNSIPPGFPGPTVLATASLAPLTIPVIADFVPVTFAAPPSVTAGTQYSIVASSTTGMPNYNWRKNSVGNPYLGGALTIGPTPDNVMGPSTGDATFRTYVAPPTAATATPAAAPTGQKAAALKKCKKKKSKKAKKKCRKKAAKLPV